MITDIEEYFSKGCGRCERFATADCSTRQWSSGLADLRRICLGSGLVETVKWGQPCYMHGDRNIVINLNSEKKSETRITRIARFRDRILAGKGANERLVGTGTAGDG